MQSEIEILEAIATNLKTLVDSDATSVEDCIIYSKDLDDINAVIQRKTLEDILPNNLEDLRCGNCGDASFLHENDTGKCSAFGTCTCKKFVDQSVESLEVPYTPGDP